MSIRGFKRLIEMSPGEREDLIDRLDAEPEAGAEGHDRSRVSYPVTDIPMCIEHPQGGEGRFLVYGRHLSRSNISVIHGGFLHVGSSCRVVLPMLNGKAIVVVGLVTRCRLVGGSWHEVGIDFREDIDTDQFTALPAAEKINRGETRARRVALRGTLLLAESYEPERALLTEQLRRRGLDLHVAATPGAVLDACKRSRIDLVLSGLSAVRDDGVGTIERLRTMGFGGPILMMTAETNPRVMLDATAAGATAIVNRPVTIDLLVAQLRVYLDASDPPTALVSTVAAMPEVKSLIQPYIQSVRLTADQIDKAFATQDVDYLRELCLRLRSSGCTYGFQDLTVAATSVLNAVDLDIHGDAQQKHVRRLIQCSRAMAES